MRELGRVDELVDRALAHDKMAVSRLVSLFEDQRAGMGAQRQAVMELLVQRGRRESAVIGLTGTPGSGKSTLMSRIVPTLLAARPEMHVAVLAVDPSSTISGGALLGDRTRMQLTEHAERMFFRSQASATELGGLGPWSFSVCRLLCRLFDVVLVETVGIGQSETDIHAVADRTYLVLQPLGGDEIQFLKAGIMELPDAFVLNKCDEPSSDRSYHQLRASLWLSRPFDGKTAPIFRTSARTGVGIDELTQSILEQIDAGRSLDSEAREAQMFERWVRDEWGRAGLQYLRDSLGGAQAYVREHTPLERAQQAFAAAWKRT